MEINVPIYRQDCLHFRGDIPCKPHKQHGVHCSTCEYFERQTSIVLIIKLGAVGDVIRTTPLLHKITNEFPGCAVWWLTFSPDVLPSELVTSFTPSALSLGILGSVEFEAVINLDKDLEACAVASSVRAIARYGFTLHNGKPAPCNDNALPKFLRGIFDDYSKQNTESYPQEIFSICGWKFEGEEYVLPPVPAIKIPALEHRETGIVIGLNTGCGERWTSRLWELARWEELIVRLQNEGMTPLLLGGEQEVEKNRELHRRTGAIFTEPTSLRRFFGVMNLCDIIVTGVTMGLHIAIGLKKRVIVMNNIFNPHEFELYGRGEIVSPAVECTCYYRPVCTNSDYRCMEHLSVDTIYDAVMRQCALIQA